MDLRSTIDLIETKSQPLQIEQAKLPYPRDGLAPVMSTATINYHYNKLYKGYVDRYNAKEGDKTFNEAGAYLHNIFFTQFRRPKSNNLPTGASLGLMNRKHGSFDNLRDAMLKAAMSIQGSGWVYMSRQGEVKTIHNHQIKRDIALLIDWWEHAWALDYAADKQKYFNNIWRIIDWEVINRRIYAGLK